MMVPSGSIATKERPSVRTTPSAVVPSLTLKT
jgi:hypothetical protein